MPFAKNAKGTPTYFCALPGALGIQEHRPSGYLSRKTLMSYYKRRKLKCLIECELEGHYLHGLNRYIQYGIHMRELFEHSGPYEFRRSAIHNDEYFHIGSIQSEAELKSHKRTYYRLSAESLIASAFSLFEHLLANTFNELYQLAKADGGEIASGLFLVWDRAQKEEFASVCEIEGVGSDEWRNRNHLWDEQKRKITMLDKHFGTGIKTKKLKSGYSWLDFCNSRSERISIVHSTGKQSIFGGRAHGDPQVFSDQSKNTLNWVIWLSGQIESALYTLPVFEDKQAGKPAEPRA